MNRESEHRAAFYREQRKKAANTEKGIAAHRKSLARTRAITRLIQAHPEEFHGYKEEALTDLETRDAKRAVPRAPESPIGYRGMSIPEKVFIHTEGAGPYNEQ